MEGTGTSGARLPAYWLISKRGHGQTELFTVDVGGENTLPIFSFEEEARLFWLFEGLGTGWKIEKTPIREVRRALFAPRTRANTVLLDPLPAVFGEETNLLVSLGREEFARRLYAERATGPSGRPRRRCLGRPYPADAKWGRRGK